MGTVVIEAEEEVGMVEAEDGKKKERGSQKKKRKGKKKKRKRMVSFRLSEHDR